MFRIAYLTGLLSVAIVSSIGGIAEGQEVPGLVAAVEQTLVDVIARSEKSVVAIARVQKEQAGETFALEFRPDPFGRRIVPAAGPAPTDPDFIPNEYGTGVVIDRAGLILTAYHVLSENSDYYVRTSDRKTYLARIKAADPRSDLAVLAIDAVDLVPITFGDAAELKKGQIVVTLGNPYAIARDGQASAGWGIVANLARKAPPTPSESDPSGKPTLHHFGTLIQTDAKLNLGTSGGPLLNLKGQMVGLTVAWAALAGYETSAGYAIPVDATFRRVVDTLRDGREVQYGLLGIQPTNLRPQEILAGMDGIRVDRVVPGTPAEKYGLRPDDIVTAVGDTPIHEADSLVLEVGKLPVEAVARLTVLRDGRPRTLNVTLAKYPVRGKKIVTNRPEPWRGLQVDYPTAMLESGTPAATATAAFDEGVIVTEVAEGSPGWQSGLRPGMLITHVGRTSVHNPGQFREVAGAHAGPVELRMANNPQNPVVTVAP